MTKRTVYDESGNMFEIADTLLSMPVTGPTVSLTDTETGEIGRASCRERV